MTVNRFLILILVAFLFVQPSCIKSQKSQSPESIGLSSETLELASNKMQEYIDKGKLAGISAMVVKEGETVYRKNFGFADKENQNPVENNTIYRIYSMTKPITGVALMILYDEGKFRLDDNVSKYIPEFEGAKVYNMETNTLEPQTNEMTIRHLLTHTSGITYGWNPTHYVDSLYRAYSSGAWEGKIGEKVKIIAGLPLKYQPGTKWEYGLSIDVAGYLIEVLSGIPLDEFFKTRIFGPLKMNDTGFYVPEEKHDRFSVLYSNEGGELKSVKNQDFIKPVTLFSGGGGLVSTMDDYLKFCKMLLNGGELNGVRILKDSTAELIMTDQLPEGVKYSQKAGYGLAGAVEFDSGSYGWAGAASTKFWIYPEDDMIVFAFAQLMPWNYAYANDFNDIVKSAVVKNNVPKFPQ